MVYGNQGGSWNFTFLLVYSDLLYKIKFKINSWLDYERSRLRSSYPLTSIHAHDRNTVTAWRKEEKRSLRKV